MSAGVILFVSYVHKCRFSRNLWEEATGIAQEYAYAQLKSDSNFIEDSRNQPKTARRLEQYMEGKRAEILLSPATAGEMFLERDGLTITKQKSWSGDVVCGSILAQVKHASQFGGELSYVFEKRGIANYALNPKCMFVLTLADKPHFYHVRVMFWMLKGLFRPPKKSSLKTKAVVYDVDLPESFQISRRKGEADRFDTREIASWPDVPDPLGGAVRRWRQRLPSVGIE